MTETHRSDQPLGGMPVATAPTWTNPLVGMFALMGAVFQDFGQHSVPVMRTGLRNLGRRTGQAMLEANLIAENCTPTEWGRFTHQLMDLTGMYEYDELTSSPSLYEFVVPSAAWPYHEPVRYLGAPPEACDISADWDRGCLDVINPRILMSQPECSGRGDDRCLWRYELTDTSGQDSA
jgi:hypothetical protein